MELSSIVSFVYTYLPVRQMDLVHKSIYAVFVRLSDLQLVPYLRSSISDRCTKTESEDTVTHNGVKGWVRGTYGEGVNKQTNNV